MKLKIGNLYRFDVFRGEMFIGVLLPGARLDHGNWQLNNNVQVPAGNNPVMVYIGAAEYANIRCAVVLIGEQLAMVVENSLKAV